MDTQGCVNSSVDGSGRNSPSESSDSDAVNTSTAKVYFGPIQSAEKQRAQRVNLGHPTPVRRSTRLSAILPLQKQDHGPGGTDPSVKGEYSNQSSGSETPGLADDMLEEPSSALATKVLRAWDNPSPPPSPRPQLAPTSVPTPEENDVVEIAVKGDGIAENMGVQPIDEPGTKYFTSTTADIGPAQVEEDLISFDSYDSPSSGPIMRVMPATPPNPSRGTVDDLLSLTPLPLVSARLNIASNDNVATVTDTARQSSPSAADEAEVTLALSNPAEVQVPSPIIPPAEATPDAQIPLVILTPTPEPEPRTPLRRSTRPRQSVSPFLLPLTTPLSTPAVGPAPSTPNTSATRRRRAKSKGTDGAQPASPGPPTSTAAENAVALLPPTSTIDELLVELSNEIITQTNTQNDPATTIHQPNNSTPAKPSTSNTKLAEHRLGSLSPTSNTTLLQLLPSTETSNNNSTVDPTASSSGSTAAPPDDPPKMAAAPATILAIPSTPQRSSMPIRNNEITRTPALRIPIKEAIAQGSLSPEKARTLMTPGRPGPVRGLAGMPPFSPHDPPRSPARRVLIEQASHVSQSSQKKGKTPVRPSSPLKGRSASVDPIPTPVFVPKYQRSASVEPPKPRIPTLRKPASVDSATKQPNQPSPLPFPLVSRFPSTILEVDEQVAERASQRPTASELQSTLRQPSQKAESKIPRPGAKPYARPAPPGTNAIARTSQLPALTKAKTGEAAKKVEVVVPALAAAPRPMRMVRKVSAKPIVVDSSSDTDSVQPVAGPGPRTLSHRSATVLPIAQAPSIVNLKRKREVAESRASPNARPVVLLRKVTMAPSTTKPPALKARTSPSPARKVSPTRARTAFGGATQGMIKMRKVVDKRKPKEAPPIASSSSEQDGHSGLAAKPSEFPVDSPQSHANFVEVMSSPVVGGGEERRPVAEEVLVQGAASSMPTETPALDVPKETMPDERLQETTSEHESDGGRRMTRRRKSVQSSTDVFGPIVASSSSRQSQRYKSTLPPDNSAFSGMSALALKSLTATNTLRNQKQFSALTTEVIMKEGKRPDSPTTKVRTTLEQQKEERNQQREERAARRARKTTKADGLVPDEEFDLSIPIAGPGDLDNSKHMRGPGDEEDYETPERPERPLKRGRFETGNQESSSSSNGDDRPEKRVKWDRGLAKTFFLTGTPPNPKRPPKEELTKKGCLTNYAKTLRLDTMGNALNADVPVPDIAPESITVQKFVYEDDPEAQPEPSSPAKATRSKSKKTKS